VGSWSSTAAGFVGLVTAETFSEEERVVQKPAKLLGSSWQIRDLVSLREIKLLPASATHILRRSLQKNSDRGNKISCSAPIPSLEGAHTPAGLLPSPLGVFRSGSPSRFRALRTGFPRSTPWCGLPKPLPTSVPPARARRSDTPKRQQFFPQRKENGAAFPCDRTRILAQFSSWRYSFFAVRQTRVPQLSHSRNR
jgi:hypothetical protein